MNLYILVASELWDRSKFVVSNISKASNLERNYRFSLESAFGMFSQGIIWSIYALLRKAYIPVDCVSSKWFQREDTVLTSYILVQLHIILSLLIFLGIPSFFFFFFFLFIFSPFFSLLGFVRLGWPLKKQ